MIIPLMNVMVFFSMVSISPYEIFHGLYIMFESLTGMVDHLGDSNRRIMETYTGPFSVRMSACLRRVFFEVVSSIVLVVLCWFYSFHNNDGSGIHAFRKETIHVFSRAPFSTSTISCKTWLKGGDQTCVLLKSLKFGEMIKLDLRIYDIIII